MRKVFTLLMAISLFASCQEKIDSSANLEMNSLELHNLVVTGKMIIKSGNSKVTIDGDEINVYNSNGKRIISISDNSTVGTVRTYYINNGENGVALSSTKASNNAGVWVYDKNGNSSQLKSGLSSRSKYSGNSYSHCSRCGGDGTINCGNHDTNGDGYCTSCNNSGFWECYRCNGSGREP